MSTVKPKVIYKPSDNKGETVKLQKEKTDHGERFSLRFSNKMFKSTFTDLQNPVCFMTDYVPNKSKPSYLSVDMPGIRDSPKLEVILEHNTVKKVKKVNLENSMGVENAYILELHSTEIVSMGEIVTTLRDSYRLEQDLVKEIKDLQKTKHSLLFRLLHPKNKNDKEIKQKVRKLSERRQNVMKELHKLDLNVEHFNNITKGELMPLHQLIYPDRHYNTSVIITTHKPLEMLKI